MNSSFLYKAEIKAMRLFYYIKRFWEIPLIEKRLFINGILISGFFYFVTKTIPCKYYMNLLHEKKQKFLNEEENTIHTVNILKRSLKRIEKLSPWKLTCLNKGITFKILSNSINLDCSLSVNAIKLDNGNLIAHSYIIRNNEIIYLRSNRFNDARGLLNIQ